ncbi:hypothetical protein C8R47DRAFT_1215779 [Mycena vitilis]|nr:hypothetical protein C8R47DRAFT_1215779 [Mycena vitilis]
MDAGGYDDVDVDVDAEGEDDTGGSGMTLVDAGGLGALGRRRPATPRAMRPRRSSGVALVGGRLARHIRDFTCIALGNLATPVIIDLGGAPNKL